MYDVVCLVVFGSLVGGCFGCGVVAAFECGLVDVVDVFREIVDASISDMMNGFWMYGFR